jgi:hypothetical protein
MEQLKQVLAKDRDQDIRDAQEQTLVNETHIEGCLTRDADRADMAGVAIMHEMARYEISL